jgi:hypothetical protein
MNTKPKPRIVTREEIYKAVWAEPVIHLATRWDIPVHELNATCEALNIPKPPRGYWNKLNAGKADTQTQLPPRGFGVPFMVTFNNYHFWYTPPQEILDAELPIIPELERPLEAFQAEAEALAEKALPVASQMKIHPKVTRVADRRGPEISFYPERRLFEEPFEKRRLSFISRLFNCMERCGTKVALNGVFARGIVFQVGSSSVEVAVDSVDAPEFYERNRYDHNYKPRGDQAPLKIRVSGQEWRDKPGCPLAEQIREIAVAILVAGEQFYRNNLEYSRNRMISDKTEAQAELEEMEAEALERRREARDLLRKKRRRILLDQAKALRQAKLIREFVSEAIKSAPGGKREKLESWSSWALSVADDLDPLRNGRFLKKKSG